MPLPKPTWHPWIPSDHFAPGGLADGLMGAWFALEGAGPTAHDLSRRGNHGTLQGGVDWVAGRDGPALDFPGTTGSFVDTDAILLNGATELSVVARVKTETLTGGADNLRDACSRNIAGAATTIFILRLATASDEFQFFVGGSSFVGASSGSSSVAVDTQYDVAGVLGNGAVKIYLDGRERDSTAKSTATGTDADVGVDIGSSASDPLRLWQGAISHVLLFNRALPASQIRRLHHNPTCLLRPVRRWWPVALEVEAEPPAFAPQTYTADVLVNISPTVSVDANPSPSTDLESNPSPTVEVESG